MPREHARRCNSTACSGGRFKLFGVQIDAGEGSNIRKSKSLDNLQSFNSGNAAAKPSGYLSDGLVHQTSQSNSRKKGKPWTEEEHRSFLVGLETLGKGDWKGIATKYVPTRNSSQVASHAQKYFIRKSATEKKRRRLSVFDIPLGDHVNQPSQGGSQADKSAEISQFPSTIRVPERPPLSPMIRHGSVPNLSFYASRLTALSKGVAPQTVKPTVAWVPMVTYTSESGDVFIPKTDGTLGLVQKEAAQASGAGVAPHQASKDELSVDIMNLTL